MTAPFRSNCLAAVGLVERASYLSCRPPTVVMPSLSVSAFYCPATAISPALSVQLQIACLFLRSSVPILDSNTVTLQSLACPGTKTSVIASVTAFSHNLGLGCQCLHRMDHNVMPPSSKFIFCMNYYVYLYTYAQMYSSHFTYMCLELFKRALEYESKPIIKLWFLRIC